MATIEQAKRELVELETAILVAVRSYEKEVGLTITDIKLIKCFSLGGPPFTVQVKVTAVLE